MRLLKKKKLKDPVMLMSTPFDADLYDCQSTALPLPALILEKYRKGIF
jgi:hypothetical protein